MEGDGLGDRVAKAVHEAYDRLPKSGKPAVPREWTILAGVVLCDGAVCDVVALGTGSKCLGAETVCGDGTILSDSHAEVICRRAFLVYLQSQLDVLAVTGRSTVFQMSPKSTQFSNELFEADSSQLSEKCAENLASSATTGAERVRSSHETSEWWLAVNPNLQFHLYISQTPCGDASIFDIGTKLDGTDTAAAAATACVDDTPTALKSAVFESGDRTTGAQRSKRRRVEDVHRTGAKAVKGSDGDPLGPGREYHRTGLLRTKPGRGSATQSMSCSDKICKWCVVGCQGALLSQIIPPIYFNTVVVGELYDLVALRRALSDRLPEDMPSLPPGYRVHRPQILGTSLRFVHGRERSDLFVSEDGKKPGPAGASVGWAVLGSDGALLDVTNRGRKQGVPKKQRDVHIKYLSKLSRVALWMSFDNVCKKLSSFGSVPPSDPVELYCNAKQRAYSYCAAKAAFLAVPPFSGWVGYGQTTQTFPRLALSGSS